VKFEDVNAVVRQTRYMPERQGRIVYDFIVENRLGRILELGFAHGKSTCYFAAAADELDRYAHVVTMDRANALDRQPNIHELLDRCGLRHRVTPVFAQRSFTWDLMRLLDQQPLPKFDFVYIDGGHTWDVSGFCFLLVDRLMAPAGWVLFDDLDWSFASSPSLHDAPFVRRLPEEERVTPQVRKVFELLVQTHPDYTDVAERDGWGWAHKARMTRRFGVRRRALLKRT